MVDNEEQTAPEFTLVQLGKVPEGAIEDVAIRVSEKVADRLAKNFVPREEFAKVLSNQKLNFKEHADFRVQHADIKLRVDQMRRGFGFNGKLNDPDAEALIADTWKEMRALATIRREEIGLERAQALVRANLIARLGPLGKLWTSARWVIIAITSAILWQFGSAAFLAVKTLLHSSHFLGQ